MSPWGDTVAPETARPTPLDSTHNILLNPLYVIHKKSEFKRLQIILMSFTETLDLQTSDKDPSRIKV
jgi:hypothetical protein